MAGKGTPVKPKEVERMVRLYNELGTYSAVAKKMRRSTTTVAKYIGQREAIKQVGHYYEDIIEQLSEEAEEVVKPQKKKKHK